MTEVSEVKEQNVIFHHKKPLAVRDGVHIKKTASIDFIVGSMCVSELRGT